MSSQRPIEAYGNLWMPTDILVATDTYWDRKIVLHFHGGTYMDANKVLWCPQMFTKSHGGLWIHSGPAESHRGSQRPSGIHMPMDAPWDWQMAMDFHEDLCTEAHRVLSKLTDVCRTYLGPQATYVGSPQISMGHMVAHCEDHRHPMGLIDANRFL